jgi:hypothetical protein
MQKLVELKDFDSFILEKKENNAKRDSFVEKAISKIKKEYGLTATDFIAATRKRGVDEVQDFIAKTVEPFIDENGGEDLFYDYDSLLSGLVSWILFTTELKLDKKR